MQSTPFEHAQRVLEAAPDAIIVIDDSGCVRYANQHITALFGYSPNELVGQGVERLMPERFWSRHVGHRDDYFASVRIRPMGQDLDLFGRRRDGSEFPVEISLSPIQTDERLLVAAAIRDVTDRKRVEVELILARQAADSARLAADQAREIADEARDSADRANEGKSRFLATASHDLRQPLQTLSLLNGTLKRMLPNPDAAEVLDQQEQAIGAMSRLLNALLDISKLESGAIKPEPTDFTVAALFEELRRDFAGVAGSKGLRFEIESCEDYVHSDLSLIQQVLRNLVSNAIKYTREGVIRLRCLHEATFVRVEVLDTGIGIPTDQIPFIYDEFYQVGISTNRSRDGYGLGLAIVQRIVKLLKVRLDVKSEVGKGSAFSLMLPAGRIPVRAIPAPRESAATPSSQIGRAQILLVEDDPSVRAATRMLLTVEGYRVTAVASLFEALQAVRERQEIDLLITDYHLADGEVGTDVITRVREALGLPLKAVLMTGDTSAAIRDLPRDPGMRVTSKPVNVDELLTLLRALLAS